MSVVKLIERPWLVGQRYGLIEITSGTTSRNRFGNILVQTVCRGCGTYSERLLGNLEHQDVKRCRSCAKKKVPLPQAA